VTHQRYAVLAEVKQRGGDQPTHHQHEGTRNRGARKRRPRMTASDGMATSTMVQCTAPRSLEPPDVSRPPSSPDVRRADPASEPHPARATTPAANEEPELIDQPRSRIETVSSKHQAPSGVSESGGDAARAPAPANLV
jgi:hypothetical protein